MGPTMAASALLATKGPPVNTPAVSQWVARYVLYRVHHTHRAWVSDQ